MGRAGIVKRGGTFDTDGHGAADDLYAADKPRKQRTRGRAAGLAREEILYMQRYRSIGLDLRLGAVGHTSDGRDAFFIEESAK